MKKTLIFLLILLTNFLSLYSKEGTVFYVHGFLRSYRCMLPISRALQKEGYRSCLWDYPSRKLFIEEHAENLVRDLKKIATQYPGEPIHFVTHSLGGIIVRAALNHPECPVEAKEGKALLLAPPNKGAKFARSLQKCPVFQFIFGPKAGHQLLTFQEQHINGLGNFPDEMDVCVIAGNKSSRFSFFCLQEPNDGKVTVHETYLPTPHWHYTFFVNHTWIMTHKRTIYVAKFFLKDTDS